LEKHQIKFVSSVAGDKLFASTDDGGSSNSSALTNLTYYQALLLLGIPEDEREKFILQHNVEDMTTRELDQALKERNQTAADTFRELLTVLYQLARLDPAVKVY
jgi:Protein of unknown function (DUF3102).